METALEPLRRKEILPYLEDLILMAALPGESCTPHSVSRKAPANTGSRHKLAGELSDPHPVVNLPGCGYEFSHNKSKAVSSQAGHAKLFAHCAHRVMTALSVMRLLGMMSASHVVVPMGRSPSLPHCCHTCHIGKTCVLLLGIPFGRVTLHISAHRRVPLWMELGCATLKLWVENGRILNPST